MGAQLLYNLLSILHCTGSFTNTITYSIQNLYTKSKKLGSPTNQTGRA